MAKRGLAPSSLHETDRDLLKEYEHKNEILAEIAGEEYTAPEPLPQGGYLIQKRMLDAAQKENELLEEIAEAGPGGGSSTAKALGIDYATDVITLKNKDGETLQGSGATLPAYGVTFDPATGGLTLTKNGTAVQGQTVTIPNYGSPVGVDASADMTDHDQIYLYLGTTGGGLTKGHFYYWDGSAWADGGEYAAATVQTDKTLLVEDRAADAKATGEAVGELKTQIDDVTGNIRLTVYDKKYIDLSSSPVTIPFVMVSENESKCAYAECSPGDKFTLNTKGGTAGRAFGFIAEDGTILSVGGAGGSINGVLTAPENTKYFVANSYQHELDAYTGVLVIDEIEKLKNKDSDLETSIVTGYKQFTNYRRGGIKSDGTYGSEVYMISTVDDFTAEELTEIKINNGYQIYIATKTGESTYSLSSTIKGTAYIPKGNIVKIRVLTDPVTWGTVNIDLLAQQVTYNTKSDAELTLDTNAISDLRNGEEILKGKWARGSIASNGTYIGYIEYRAALMSPIYYDRDIVLSWPDSYTIYLALYNDSDVKELTTAIASGPVIIPRNKHFSLDIRRAIEDNTEKIDPREFVKQVKINSAISDKYETDINHHTGIEYQWELGSLNNGAYYAATNRIVSEFIFVGKGTIIAPYNNSVIVNFARYTKDKKFIEGSEYFLSFPLGRLVNEDCYIRVLVSKNPVDDIDDDEISTLSDSVIIRTPIPFTDLRGLTVTEEEFAQNAIVPDYFKSQIKSVIDKVSAEIADAGVNGDNFFFITDTHWYSNRRRSPMLLRALKYNLNVNKIVCCGDIVGAADTKAQGIKDVQESVAPFKNIERFYCLRGNHDVSMMQLTPAEFYGLAQKQTDEFMVYGGLCYFYFDNTVTKSRYICLDTGNSGAVDTTQMNWLTATLSSAPADYHIIIFAHILAQTKTTWFKGMTVDDLAFTESMETIFGIVDTHNEENPGKPVIAIMGGHVHFDGDTTTTGGVPVIFTDSDSTGTNNNIDVVGGTITEQCFDVVVCNYTAQTIKCFRVGRGSDRTFTY